MNKVIRKISKMLIPKKHDELIVEIVSKQKELAEINRLAERGILGDSLLDKQIMLKNDIRLLKRWYQNKIMKEE